MQRNVGQVRKKGGAIMSIDTQKLQEFLGRAVGDLAAGYGA